MPKKFTNDNFLERARSIYGDRYEYLNPYTNMKAPIRLRCKKHDHVFSVKPFNHLYENTGCPICGKESQKKKMRIPHQEVIAKAQHVHGTDRYDYSHVGDFPSVNSMVNIICRTKDDDGNEHGVFRQSWINHIYGKQGCPHCARRAPLTNEIFIKRSQKVHGIDTFDYTLVNYKNRKTNVEIVCNKCGHHFFQTPDSHMGGSGCPECNKTKISERCRMTKDEFIQRARIVHNDKYSYSKVEYKGTDVKVCIICPRHGEYWQRPGDHLYGKQGCPICRSRDNPRLIYGVGINDLYGGEIDHHIYGIWRQMLRRCYDEKNRHKAPTYKDCRVCDEWLTFSNYQKWYKERCYNDFVVDKDILVKRNKIYSPDTCCFVPQVLNNIILRSQKARGIYPMGVFKSPSGKFCIRINKMRENKKIREIMSGFATPEEAFLAYKQAKESYIKEVAQEYYDRGEITKKVYDALMKYEIEITD